MRRQALSLIMPTLLTLTITGCMSMDGSRQLGDNPGNPGCQGNYGRSFGPAQTRALQDPWGNGVPLTGPYAASPPGNDYIARQMLKTTVDPRELDYFDENQMRELNAKLAQSGIPPRPVPPGGMVVPKGMSPFPGVPGPAMQGGQVMQAGFNAGAPARQPNNNPYYGYPYNYNPYYGNRNPAGGDVIYAELRTDGSANNPIVQAQYQPSGGYGGGPPAGYFGGMGMPGGYCPPAAQAQRMQIKFTRPNGMKVYWVGVGPDGRQTYSPYPLEVPGRYNFTQGATYRLKINNIEDRPLLELYPTLEVMVANAKTQDFLSHSAVPLSFTDDDFKQVAEGNYLVKVIYLPDPAYQDQAGTGIEEILSTRLDPGTDPVKEARSRGTVLLVIRMGNVEQELGHSPPLNAGSSSAGSMPGGMPGGPSCPPGSMPGSAGWGNPNYMPSGPGCPPGGCPPGAGYGPGMLPPTLSLGGAQGMPSFLNQRPLPQVPYMQWPYGPYANSPWCGQNQCPPGYGYGPPQYPQYQQGGQPWMSNPGATPNLPLIGPYAPSSLSAPKGSPMANPPGRLAPGSLAHEPLEPNYPRDLPRPSVDAKDDNPAPPPPNTAGSLPDVPSKSTSLSVPLVGNGENSKTPSASGGIPSTTIPSFSLPSAPPTSGPATPSATENPGASNMGFPPLPAPPAGLGATSAEPAVAPPSSNISLPGTLPSLGVPATPPPAANSGTQFLPSLSAPGAMPSPPGSSLSPPTPKESLAPLPSLSNVMPPSSSLPLPIFPEGVSAPSGANGPAQNNPVPPMPKN